mgnify:CR=1 FL=1
MNCPTYLIAAFALVLASCGSDSQVKQADYRHVYDRAIELTKNSLKYPDNATYPVFDSVTITAKSTDTVTIVFNVLASNAMGVKSKAETNIVFKLDSCAHIISGWVVNDMLLSADPIGKPCSPAAIKAWEEDRLAKAAEEVRLQRLARRAQAAEDSARFGFAKITGQKISGSHKYRGKTKVSWTPLTGLLENVRKEAKKQMLTDAALQAKLNTYYDGFQGGFIYLDIERLTIGAGNLELFTVVVQDSTGAEVYREKLKDEIPDYRSGDWTNLAIVAPDHYLRPPFNVFVIDQIEDEPLNFLINADQ